MQCLLVFDHINDIVFYKCSEEFLEKINGIARSDRIIDDDVPLSSETQANVIIHLFSPVVTSQRIMMCQFGNSYTTIKCFDNFNICFDEYMGFLFVFVGDDDAARMKKHLGVSVAMVRYLCGPDVYRLKDKYKDLYSDLLESYETLYRSNQSILIEAIEQVVVNPTLSAQILKNLKDSVHSLTSSSNCTKIHALILVQNKFLSLYSSPLASELSPADILFTKLLCASRKKSQGAKEPFSCAAYLSGPEIMPKCVPHVLHVFRLSDADLIYFVETSNAVVASSLYEAFCHFHAIQIVQIQLDEKLLRVAHDNLELAMRRLDDGLRRDGRANAPRKELAKKWDAVRRKYADYFRGASEEALLRAETLGLGLLETLKNLLDFVAIDDGAFRSTAAAAASAAAGVAEEFKAYSEFVLVKAVENLSLESFVKEFPGLVHFIYVDRNTQKMTSPNVDRLVQSTHVINKNKIWKMVEFSLRHLEEGTLLITWKDLTFSYTHFVWFEDSSGSPLKPVCFQNNYSKTLPTPGLFQLDFYQKLKQIYFSKTAPSKIRCYELFCVHLGLLNTTIILEHARRLAATIWEINGPPPHSVDLL